MRRDDLHSFSLVYDGSFAKTATKVAISALTPGALYHFRVVTSFFNGISSDSAELSVYACTAPSQFTTTTVSHISSISVMVAWDSSGLQEGGCPITGYGVFRDDGVGSAIDVEMNSLEVNNKPHLRSALVNEFGASLIGRRLNLLVRAYNVIGYA